jgi:hypothetical protein
MSNELTVGIIGLYTVIYVIVFFIQKSQIDKQKEITSSMKSFMDIFKVDEVRKFVALKEERLIMSFKDAMSDNENFKTITNKIVEDKDEEMKLDFSKEMGEKYVELLSLALKTSLNQKPEIRDKFILEILPLNQKAILKLLKEYQDSGF